MRLILLTLLLSTMISAAQETKTAATLPDQAELKKMTARFAPTPLNVDISKLSPGDSKALVKIIAAAKLLNHLFMNQFWSGNVALYQKLEQDPTPLAPPAGIISALTKGLGRKLMSTKSSFLARPTKSRWARISIPRI